MTGHPNDPKLDLRGTYKISTEDGVDHFLTEGSYSADGFSWRAIAPISDGVTGCYVGGHGRLFTVAGYLDSNGTISTSGITEITAV